MPDELREQIKKIAELQRFLRPKLMASLEAFHFSASDRSAVGDFNNYAEYWKERSGDSFFDMGTMIQLGSVIERNLKRYYMSKKGYSSIPQLLADPAYKKGIFQRIQNGKSDGVLSLYQAELSYDLTTNPHLASVQEAMMHRHLYAHNSGLLDEDYINKMEVILGINIRTDPKIAGAYPDRDVYWFEPLKKISFFIDEAEKFFSNFP